MTCVYILYNYEEHGAQDVMATLNRGDLVGMLERHKETKPDEVTSDDIKALTVLLRRSEQDLAKGWMEHRFINEPMELVHEDGRHGLSEGWGGWVLQVTELYKAKSVKFQ